MTSRCLASSERTSRSSRDVTHTNSLSVILSFVPLDQGTNVLDPKEYQERFIETWNAASGEQSIVRESFDGVRKALDLREMPISAVIVDVRLHLSSPNT